MRQSEGATERVTVLVTPNDKSALEEKASGSGISIGEQVRRSVGSLRKSRIPKQMCKVGDRTLGEGWHTLIRRSSITRL
jgi:hypothetical protein